MLSVSHASKAELEAAEVLLELQHVRDFRFPQEKHPSSLTYEMFELEHAAICCLASHFAPSAMVYDKESESDMPEDEDSSSTSGDESDLREPLSDLVPIGDGNARIPSRVLRSVNWTSHTSATRKLLTAVFSRKILATHSLTGKPSPAFPNKPAKAKLNAALVNDIIRTVVKKCKVGENAVRTSITTKCADETKMRRTRHRRRRNTIRN